MAGSSGTQGMSFMSSGREIKNAQPQVVSLGAK